MENKVERKVNKISSFHEAIGPILAVAQLFGNLPVHGIFSHDVNELRFEWISLRVFLTLSYCSIATLEVYAVLARIYKRGISLILIELIMFYFDCVLQSYIFLYLATKWKKIMKFWFEMEKPFLMYPYESTNLKRKIRIIGIIFFICYLIEHLTFAALQVEVNNFYMDSCNLTGEVSYLHSYVRRQRPHMLFIFPYRWYIFPFLQFSLTCLAFSWNFVDFFIIFISIGLSSRFNQLNSRLKNTPMHRKDSKFWNEIRSHYTNLIDLLDYVNDFLPSLLLLSMSHNIFLVMTKIMEAIKYSDNRDIVLDDFYFYFYIFFLIFRTFFLLYECSAVNHSLKKPLVVIRNSKYWNINLKRLQCMIQSETFAVTGFTFFRITREMILSLIGSIVTYELFLLDNGERVDDEGVTCFSVESYLEQINWWD